MLFYRSLIGRSVLLRHPKYHIRIYISGIIIRRGYEVVVTWVGTYLVAVYPKETTWTTTCAVLREEPLVLTRRCERGTLRCDE